MQSLDRMIATMRLQHKGERTIQCYSQWVRRYARWLIQHGSNYPDSAARATAYLTHLAQRRVSQTTQNQCFNALIYFYKHGLRQPLPEGINSLRAHVRRRIRRAPDPQVIRNLLHHVQNRAGYPTRLICHLLYAAGLRLHECLQLRLRDIKLKDSAIVVHGGKGDKDRIVTLPCALLPALTAQARHAVAVWQHDVTAGIPIQLPSRLASKFPALERSKGWAWLFPQREPCEDPANRARKVRFHLHEANVQRAMSDACRRLKLPEPITPHHLRHAWATHTYRRGTPLRDIQEHLGHSHINTTMVYLTPDPTPIASPYDALGIKV